jgi:hypothetical protein
MSSRIVARAGLSGCHKPPPESRMSLSVLSREAITVLTYKTPAWLQLYVIGGIRPLLSCTRPKEFFSWTGGGGKRNMTYHAAEKYGL